MDEFWVSAVAVVIGHVLYGVPVAAVGAQRRVTLHNGDDFADTDAGPRPDRVHDVRLVSSAGTTPLTVRGSVESGVYVDVAADAPAWLAFETRPTFIELAPEKFERYLSHEGLDDVLAARKSSPPLPGREIYSKHVKTAIGEGGRSMRFLDGPMGLPVEIVPRHPGPYAVGDTLEVRVVSGGAPIAGLQVRAQHRGRGSDGPDPGICVRTDADGRAAIPLVAPGVWRLHTIAMTRHTDTAEADWRSQWACLTFSLDSQEPA